MEERASNAHSKKCRETCSVEIDYRIPGLLHHKVQQEDHTRKEAINKLIHQFETHPNREALKSRPEAKLHLQPIQRKVAGHDPQHGKRGVLRDV